MLHCTINRMLRCTLILGALATAGCFNVDTPPCTFSCGDNRVCPDDYQCLSDGYCHLHGQMSSCGFTDAALAPDLLGSQSSDAGPDLAMTLDVDMAMPAVPTDMSESLDVSVPDDLTPTDL